jgi:hypothetical protein
MKITTKIWSIIVGILVSFSFLMALLLFALENSKTSLQDIQQLSSGWTNISFRWTELKKAYVNAQDEARDVALTDKGDPQRLSDAIDVWQSQSNEFLDAIQGFLVSHPSLEESIQPLFESYQLSAEDHPGLGGKE